MKDMIREQMFLPAGAMVDNYFIGCLFAGRRQWEFAEQPRNAMHLAAKIVMLEHVTACRNLCPGVTYNWRRFPRGQGVSASGNGLTPVWSRYQKLTGYLRPSVALP